MSALVIVCPNCGTRYNTTAEAIGPNGRKVRCARCSETWAVPAPSSTLTEDPDALELEDLKSSAPVDPTLSAEPLIPPAVAASAPLSSQPRTSKPEAVKNATKPHQPPSTVGADVMMRNQADQAKLSRRRRTLMIIWIVPLILVLIAALYALLNRQEIVNRFPQSATLYQAIGLNVKLGGLDIDPPIATTALVEGTPVVRVEGQIRNLTGKTRPVPLIELTLHSETGEALAQWFVEPTQPTLPGRGRLTFQTEYADPPQGVSRMTYQFASDS